MVKYNRLNTGKNKISEPENTSSKAQIEKEKEKLENV